MSGVVVTPCPHHPIGAKGIGECATVAGPAAFVNAVINALGGTGVRNIDMPLLPLPPYQPSLVIVLPNPSAAMTAPEWMIQRSPRTTLRTKVTLACKRL